MAGSTTPVEQPEASGDIDGPGPEPAPPSAHVNFSHDTETEELNEKTPFPSLNTDGSVAPDLAYQQDELMSPSAQRADMNRLNDDLEVLRAERLISNQEHDLRTSKTHTRTHNSDPEDAFNSPREKEASARGKDTDAALYKMWQFLRKFPRFIRYILYLLPGAALLLVPVLLGYFTFDASDNAVGGRGGVYVMWFGIWLEIVWGSLWVSRMITSLMPQLFQFQAKLSGSTNSKKWKDIGAQLELHTALFLWMLANLISFKPTCDGHRVSVPDNQKDQPQSNWTDIVNKVIIALFVLATLNFVEKICIQWIATSFHQRTYATRIENHRGDIRQLINLFEHAKSTMESTDSFWQGSTQASPSGAATPMQVLQDNARQVLGKVGHVAGRVGNDLIGRKVIVSHPQKVVGELLRTTTLAHTLARLIYRSLVREGKDTVYLEDVQTAFRSQEEAEAAFGVFDKDLNGDISIDEFEAVCNEIHLEKKAIAASLKDLDSVIQKLDKVFLFIIFIITVIVFISILSGSAAAGLASAGTSVLGLAWMLQATAQEFLQSIIFVFVKHPFDVGDRITVYGSTGANMTGDDYYVTEISLLYTEFRKMEGHIVQAPNSTLNTLFILNQRRSNGLADVNPLVIRFGTPSWMIEELKSRMLDFCLANKRDYRPQIISEMGKIDEVRSCTLNLIFFHKSNFQNELLRLTRHNKFVTELMQQMVDIGIQAPVRIEPGGSRDNPVFWAGIQPPAYRDVEGNGPKGPLNATASISAPPNVGRRPTIAVTRPDQARMMETVGDFQDVYDNRRDQVHAQRLASIQEKERAEQAEDDQAPRASASGVTRNLSLSSTKQRSGIFGRARSRSSRQHQSEYV